MNLSLSWLSADPINPETYAKDVAAVRRRLMRPANAMRERLHVVAVVEDDPVFRLPPKTKPRKLREVEHNAHVHAYRQWKMHRPVGKLQRYIVKRCIELGQNYQEVIGKSRLKTVVPTRHLLMWEIKRQVNPEISYPQLGRIFGGRDHSTAVHAVQKIDAEMARERADG